MNQTVEIKPFKANGETYFFVHDDVYNRGYSFYLEKFQVGIHTTELVGPSTSWCGAVSIRTEWCAGQAVRGSLVSRSATWRL